MQEDGSSIYLTCQCLWCHPLTISVAGMHHTVCTAAATADKQGSGASMCAEQIDPTSMGSSMFVIVM